VAGSSLFGIASASRVSNILHKGRNEGSCEHTYRPRVVSRTLPVISFNLPHRKRINHLARSYNTEKERVGFNIHHPSFRVLRKMTSYNASPTGSSSQGIHPVHAYSTETLPQSWPPHEHTLTPHLSARPPRQRAYP